MQMRWSEFIGEIVDGRYTLREVTGDGEMAADSEQGQVTLRFTPSELPESAGALSKWNAIAELSHPNLLRLYSTGRTELGEVPFIYAAFERPDDALGAVVAERPLTTDEAKDVLSALLPALEYLHSLDLAHGNVRPDQIVAVGDRIKLTSESIAPAGKDGAEQDMRALGVTISEILGLGAGDLTSPFREIAEGCLAAQPWTAQRALTELRGQRRAAPPVVMPQPEPAKALLPWPIIAGVAAVLLVMIAAWALRRDTNKRVSIPPAVVNPAPAAAPSPITENPARSERSRVESPGRKGDWAVVSAIYKNYDAAEKRVKRLRDRSKAFEPRVYPAKGEGKRYLVLIESGLTKDDAEKLRRRAVAAGLPRDTYVTRVSMP